VSSEVDELVMQTCSRVATLMTETGLAWSRLRERDHLDPFIKDAFEEVTGARPVSRKFNSKHFVGLGAVDVVVDRPPLFMELKWSYELPGKVFESVWDAIKLAVLGPKHDRDHRYVVAGASKEEWDGADCGDLFVTGKVDPLEMWERPLVPKRGPNYGATVGEDLVIGGHGNQPTEGPKSISVDLLETFPVADDSLLKLIRVDRTTDLRDWPQLTAP
jgi:hypothetical protein